MRRYQLAGALLSDSGNPLHVVHRVAHQGQDVDNLLGPDAELLPHAVGVVPGAGFAWVEDGNAVADELEEVLVTGHDRHVEAGRARLCGQRAEHVVRLERLVCEHRHAQRLACFVHVRDLLAQVRRHRRPVRLVVGGELVPEGRPPDVERGRYQGRLLVGDELPQHVDEPEDRVRRPAVRCGESAYRVICTVHLGAAVDQEDGLAGVHRAVGVYPYGVAM